MNRRAWVLLLVPGVLAAVAGVLAWRGHEGALDATEALAALRDERDELLLRLDEHEAQATTTRTDGEEELIDALLTGWGRLPAQGPLGVLARLEQLARETGVTSREVRPPTGGQGDRTVYRVLGRGAPTTITGFLAAIEQDPALLVVSGLRVARPAEPREGMGESRAAEVSDHAAAPLDFEVEVSVFERPRGPGMSSESGTPR